jgi:hypothetical protein
MNANAGLASNDSPWLYPLLRMDSMDIQFALRRCPKIYLPIDCSEDETEIGTTDIEPRSARRWGHLSAVPYRLSLALCRCYTRIMAGLICP